MAAWIGALRGIMVMERAEKGRNGPESCGYDLYVHEEMALLGPKEP